jgi:soluble lytic murein transglycosylase
MKYMLILLAFLVCPVARAKNYQPPKPLSASDVAAYRSALALAAQGRLVDARATEQGAKDDVLAGHVEGEALLVEPTAANIIIWLTRYPDHPQALRLTELLRPLMPAAALLPATVPVGNRWGVWQRAGQSDAAWTPWQAGLMAWRSNNCEVAALAFEKAMTTAGVPRDLKSAAAFWAARAHVQCERPEKSAPLLRAALEAPDSFYGLMAAKLLGVKPQLNWGHSGFTVKDWQTLSHVQAVRRTLALVQVGRLDLADRELRLHWGRANEGHYGALLRLADALDLAGAQLSLARRPLQGVRVTLADIYPLPGWRPADGFLLEKELLFAFTHQESAFAPDTVSRANARGPMQLLPGTAREISGDNSITDSDPRLFDPGFNMKIGQSYLLRLARSSITNGNLIKVIASYNGGPGNVRRWVGTLPEADPLLYIESIPLPETRDYVEHVLRNYWLYQLRGGKALPTLTALAEGRWPSFPAAGKLALDLKPSNSLVAYAN